MTCGYQTNPTQDLYGHLYRAFDLLNKELFNQQLPPVIITITDQIDYAAMFEPAKFKVGSRLLDHICLNWDYFSDSFLVLSYILHEQIHQWEFHFSRQTMLAEQIHSKTFIGKLSSLGIIASESSGDEEDQIIAFSPFYIAATRLISTGFRPATVAIAGRAARPA